MYTNIYMHLKYLRDMLMNKKSFLKMNFVRKSVPFKFIKSSGLVVKTSLHLLLG